MPRTAGTSGREVDARRRLGWILVAGGAALAPWTVFLLLTLPKNYTGHHYKASWTVFDIVLLMCMLVTGIAALRGTRNTTLAAATTGTLLFVDAWFDISGSGSKSDFRVALLTAILVEIPLGVACWRLARRASRASLETDPGQGDATKGNEPP